MRNTSYKRAAFFLKATAAVSAAGFMNSWPAGQSDSVPPPLTVQQTFALAGKAVPYLYSGQHAQTLDHLWPSKESHPAPLTPSPTATVSSDIPDEYQKELTELKEACPGLAVKANTNFNAPRWALREINDANVGTMPRRFIEAAYHTVGRSPDSTEKTRALVVLQKALPDSPAYIKYLDEKRSELKAKLEADPELQFTDATWQAASHKTKEKALSRVAELTFTTLLPENTYEMPRVVYAVKNYPSQTGYGRYSPTFNDVYIDGLSQPIRTSFDFAKAITVHETFHAFTSVLANWYVEGKLDVNFDLRRQGKIYQLSNITGGSAINIKDNSEGYMTSFGERGAWAFQLAATPQHATTMEIDMFNYRLGVKSDGIIMTPPVFQINSTLGRLPDICLAK